MKRASFVLVGILTLAGCSNKPQQTRTAPSAVVQASAPVPIPSVPAPQHKDEISGIVRPGDGDEFVAEPVLNECGTVGEPYDCVVKDVEVPSDHYLVCPTCNALAGIDEDTGSPLDGEVKDTVKMEQVTLRREDGSYMTLACAFDLQPESTVAEMAAEEKDEIENWTTDPDDPDDSPVEDTGPEYWDGQQDGRNAGGGWFGPYEGMNPRKNLCDSDPADTLHVLKVGQNYRFSRRENTVLYRLDKSLGERRWYFLVLGTCSSVHECQAVPRNFHVKDYRWPETVAPWAWQAYRQLEARYPAIRAAWEARQKRLATPR